MDLRKIRDIKELQETRRMEHILTMKIKKAATQFLSNSFFLKSPFK